MALILNIETSSPVCSVCLAKDGILLDYREDQKGNSHAKILTVFIDSLLSENKISIHELDAVAISSGPGSYTGLRIGTSVAKGLCYALNKPLITVPTLLSLATAIQKKTNDASAYYMPVMDARRMDVYTAIFDSNLNELRNTSCATLNEEFEKSLDGLINICIGGNAVNKCKVALTSENFTFIDEIYCDSRDMFNISHKKYLNNEFENVAYFEPFYLKEFPVVVRN